ncbi:MAG: DUF4230 domain-containing protein [Phascolarctobacterium sp.]|nr:DUF4230 domain-containing protein [Phascolarctobacterium sp.]
MKTTIKAILGMLGVFFIGFLICFGLIFHDIFGLFSRLQDFKIEHNTENITVVMNERLEKIGELATAEMLCTMVEKYEDQASIFDFAMPGTKKKIIVSYDGIVKAGIKNLKEAKVERVSKNEFVVTVPDVEIFEPTILFDSYKELHVETGIFTSLEFKDTNDILKNMKIKMKERAYKNKILDKAREHAKTIISSLLAQSIAAAGVADFKITVEFK